LHDYFKNNTLALIGYGSQGHGQGLNARDNGLSVIVGVRENGESWKQALEDGWVPGETLFPIEEAIQRGTIIMNLLSDAAQSSTWPTLAPLITKGKTLYFSRGFSVVYKEDAKFVPPVGRRRHPRSAQGIRPHPSHALQGGPWHQLVDYRLTRRHGLGEGKGHRNRRCDRLGLLYETTFERKVYSALYGERGVLMDGMKGIFLAQYKALRENGHSPSEAFNETVEEVTQSLFPLIGAKWMGSMYDAHSTLPAVALSIGRPSLGR